MERFGVDAEEAKAAVVEAEAKISNAQKKQKEKSLQDMEVDTEPVVKSTEPSSKLDKAAAKKKKKEVKAAKKAAEKEAAKNTKAAEEGSSSESSSDEEEEEVEKAEAPGDASSDEELDANAEDEEADYELNDEADDSEKARLAEYKNALAEWRKLEAEAIKNYKSQRRLLRAGRKQAPPPELSHHFVTTVIERCFTVLPNGQPDMSFWPAKVITYLIENQLVGNANPGAGQSGIALNLMEREQWPLLELAFKKLYDIPEMDMVTMLKQVIGLNKSESTKLGSSSVPDVPHFLNLIMVAPRNEVFMQQALKRMSIEELSIVLEILKSWIEIWDERGGIGHQKQAADKKQLPGGLPGYGLVSNIVHFYFPFITVKNHTVVPQ
jgi:hypothetical protein